MMPGRCHVGAALLAVGVLVLIGSVYPSAAQQGDTRTGYKSYAEAMTAYRVGDIKSYALGLARADSLLPGQPALKRRMAGALARLGQYDAAAVWLTRLAAMDVRSNLEADKDLESLRGRPEYAAASARLAALDRPISSSRKSGELPEKGLITEGIAWDERAGRIFVSSVHQRKIVSLDQGEQYATWAPAPGESLLAPLAMTVDRDNQSLWVTTAAIPEMIGFDSNMEGRCELRRLDLKTARTLGAWSIPDTGRDHNLNDLVLDGRGRLFLSDSQSGAIYRLANADDQALEIFLPRGSFGSPNGLAVSSDDSRLYVADYTLGIYVVDMAAEISGAASGAINRLAAPDSLCLNGVDGLVAIKDGLVLIQNGISPHRIVRLTLDPTGRRVTSVLTLDRDNPEWDEPTLGVLIDQELFYNARSQWGRVLPGGGMPPLDSLAAPAIMQVRVE
ncbi:MAG: SMP-30/gluconolactonase/LRE family protein [Candidatus Eisenbacteria bacterium]|nr:SMP-30/gluconolactonase/LRE family protein [Candidatus Eisenbacteria bacterium]